MPKETLSISFQDNRSGTPANQGELACAPYDPINKTNIDDNFAFFISSSLVAEMF
jgi:hypothetical protein